MIVLNLPPQLGKYDNLLSVLTIARRRRLEGMGQRGLEATSLCDVMD
jgi:hypothetical protein